MKPQPIFCLLAVVLISCGEKPAPTPSSAPPSSGGNPLTAPVDYLGANAKAKTLATKVAADTSLTQAIALFHSEHDRFPKSLEELVSSGQLRALPKAPYQMKFDYNAKTGEVKIVPQ